MPATKFLSPDDVTAGQSDDAGRTENLDSATVSASRAGKHTPVTFTTVSAEELRKAAPLSSLPMVLDLQPSVVSTNEGGTGLGYSKLTLRGIKGSQLNVTLNGITLNDQESQEVFWVNTPSLTSILSSVQLQRGLGTSANGAGAFGGSINMSTASAAPGYHGSFELGRGSWNTLTTSFSAGTGLLQSGLYFDVACSKNLTDGYIRNAFADVQSAFAVIGWIKKRNSLRLTYLMGDQRTGITWNGEPYAKFAQGDYKYNTAGAYTDGDGNLRYYDNETDNYRQHHLQLSFTHQFSDGLFWSTTLNRTKGSGYYEQYKEDRNPEDYALFLGSQGVGGWDEADFVVHKAMDNAYNVLSSNLRYLSDRLSLTGGVYLSSYDGDHFGEVVWSSLPLDLVSSPDHWYDNNGLKREINFFARAEWKPIEWLTAFVDLQYRGISLNMQGVDDDLSPLDYSRRWDFFNPRAGLTANIESRQRLYASISLGHREPGRGDLKENIKSILRLEELGDQDTDLSLSLKEERMVDLEAGYAFESERLSFGANLYLMHYKDMLLETGKLSSTGYAIKENIPRSFRRGVELSLAWRPFRSVRIDANSTLSSNKLLDYTAWYEDYDPDWNFVGQHPEHFDKVDILHSPSFVGMLRVSYSPFAGRSSSPFRNTTLALSFKRVGSQYWDNTGSLDRQIPAYTRADLGIGHEFNVVGGKLAISAFVSNLLDKRYYADAWVYRAHFTDGTWYQEEGVFPQAPIHAILKLSYRFGPSTNH